MNKNYLITTHQNSCCKQLNSNRKSINAISIVVDGKIINTHCEWCNSKLPNPSKDSEFNVIKNNTKLDKYLFNGKVIIK